MGFEGGERKLGDKNEETEHLLQGTFLCFVFCLMPQPSVSTPSILILPKVAKLLEERNGETSQDNTAVSKQCSWKEDRTFDGNEKTR